LLVTLRHGYDKRWRIGEFLCYFREALNNRKPRNETKRNSAAHQNSKCENLRYSAS
jgi:hypothetical protein